MPLVRRRLLFALMTVSLAWPTLALEAAAAKATGSSAAKRASSGGTTAQTAAPTKAKSSAAARRARLARARAAQRAREAKDAATPRFKRDEHGELVPDVRAAAAIVYNPVTHEVLYETNAQDTRSIASITKVMTAVVFLEHEFDLTREVVVNPVDMRGASTTVLRARERVSVDDLLHLLLIASDNVAARTLARASIFGSDGFIERMNQKAVELGLEHTRYADPSGLHGDNVASAYDMARLIAFAANDERIAPIMRKTEHEVRTSRRTVTVKNTNKLLGTDVDVRGGKTGFIRRAGYCLATLLQLPQGDQVAVVVLGAKSSAHRFMEARHLTSWLVDKAQALLAGDARTQEE